MYQRIHANAISLSEQPGSHVDIGIGWNEANVLTAHSSISAYDFAQLTTSAQLHAQPLG